MEFLVVGLRVAMVAGYECDVLLRRDLAIGVVELYCNIAIIITPEPIRKR